QHINTYPGANTAVPTAACAGTAGTAAAGTEAAFLEQLSLYTDANGGACSVRDANHEFGPYLKKDALPPEPFSNVSVTEVIAAGDLNMTATTPPAAGPGGYKYDTLTGKVIINLVAEQGR
ncbi:MAG: hypothetical protein PVJ83_06010, partial [Gammaproteobacteria bacterium]